MTSQKNFFSDHTEWNVGNIYVTGGKFELNGTPSVPKSVPRLVVDKAGLLFWSEVF